MLTSTLMLFFLFAFARCTCDKRISFSTGLNFNEFLKETRRAAPMIKVPRKSANNEIIKDIVSLTSVPIMIFFISMMILMSVLLLSIKLW